MGSPGYLTILNDIGALALIDQHITLWQNKPLLSDNIIRNKKFNHASELLQEAVKRHRITWIEFAALLPWRMGQELMSRVGKQLPARDFDALVHRLQDFMMLQSQQRDQLIAASNIPGRGVLYDTENLSVANYFRINKAQHPERLRLFGAVLKQNRAETQSIIDVICEYGFAPEFGLNDDMMEVENVHAFSSSFVDYKSVLRSKLNPAYTALGTDITKDAHIRSVLTDPKLNQYIAQRIDWILPNNATFFNLLETNPSPEWAELVAVLIDIAESANGVIDHTFPTTNAFGMLSKTICDCVDKLPFLQLALYSPTTPLEQREEMWREKAPTVISQYELISLLKLPQSMAQLNLSPELLEQLWTKLTLLLNEKTAARADILMRIAGNRNFNLAELVMIRPELFQASQPREYSFAKPAAWKWPGGKNFLAEIKIENEALATQLDDCYAQGYFAATKKEHWPTMLIQLGAVGIQPLAVTTQLFKVGLIHE